MKKARLTIAICTYNRNHLIEGCINSILVQKKQAISFPEIIVIDNFDNNLNHRDLQDICSRFTDVRLFFEKRAGLSHARNKAISLCKSDFIAFLDDDALAQSGYINKLLHTIDTFSFDCFGGSITSTWIYGRPRWLPEDYGNKPALSDTTSIINEGYIWGSNMVFKLASLKAVDGFPVDTGMKAKKLGYAAENLVQIEMRKRGMSIGYVPDLSVLHIVSKEKLNISWHLKASFAGARDGRLVFPENYTAFAIIMLGLRIPVILLKSCLALINDPTYYWENLVLDLGKHLTRISGSLVAQTKQ